MKGRTPKLFTVTDLGPGDGGKGGVVHKLCHMMRAHTVIKVGGAQGSHGVRTANGEHFAFSQFGCGTFGGTRTHLSPRFIIDPNALINEGEALHRGWQIDNAFDLLTVDENALCATPFHRAASQLRELGRKGNPRGTIGTGVGAAYRDMETHLELAIYARDIDRAGLRGKLHAIRDRMLASVASVILEGFWDSDRAEADELIARLHDEDLVTWTAHRFREMARRVKIVPSDYMAHEILSQDGVVVVESSHGVLTDKLHGFHPHTSAIRTLPSFTHAMLRDAGYKGRVVNLGVTRAYQIRHGAGPMVTHDPLMGECLLPGSSKHDNRYQGSVRVGPLDLVSLRYAIEVCGGPKKFDGVAITWFDQIERNGSWQVCERYQGSDNSTYFNSRGEILVGSEIGFHDDEQLEHQAGLTAELHNCRPVLTEHVLPENATRNDLVELVRGVIEPALGLPVKMISFGPTEIDKVCL